MLVPGMSAVTTPEPSISKSIRVKCVAVEWLIMMLDP